MPQTRIDIKGIMTDLPPENIPQGACQEMVNLRFLDGAWRPVGTKKIDWQHSYDCKMMHMHIVESFAVKIVNVYGNLSYLKYNSISQTWSYITIASSLGDDIFVRSVNNLLMVYKPSTGKVYYTRMVIEDGDFSYTDLLPFEITLPMIDFYGQYNTYIDKYFTTLEDQKNTAIAIYEQAEAELADNAMFASKMYVRYALKMFDGSYIFQSNIFEVIADFSTYVHTIDNLGKDVSGISGASDHFDVSDKVSWKHIMRLHGSYLRFTVVNSTINDGLITNIKKYKDIIKSIDIFTSDPVNIWDKYDLPCFPRDDSSPLEFSYVSLINTKEIDGLLNFYLFRSIPIDKLASGTDEALGFVSINKNAKYTTGVTFDKMAHNEGGSEVTYTDYSRIKSTTADKFLLYDNKGTFTSRRILPVEDNSDQIVGLSTIIYNNRVIAGNITSKLFSGIPSRLFIKSSTNNCATTLSYVHRVYVFYKIETEEGEKIVRASTDYEFYPAVADQNKKILINPIVAYPNVKCKELQLYIYYNAAVRAGYTYEMRPHPFLNMAYAFIGDVASYDASWFELDPSVTNANTTLPTVDDIIHDRNRVMISRVNNPFSFRVEDTNNVGVNDIVGIVTNSKQMTEGQFGMHPIIVLTKFGIYAIEVNQGPVFTSRIVPVNSDECLGGVINFYSKTLAQDVIVYLSRTGVKMLNGNQSVDLTQFVKYDKPSVLNEIRDAFLVASDTSSADCGTITSLGLTPNSPFLITNPSQLTANGKYGEFSADYGSYKAGTWVYKQSGSPTYVYFDKTYWFFANLDNYLVPHVDESTGWDNNNYDNQNNYE